MKMSVLFMRDPSKSCNAEALIDICRAQDCVVEDLGPVPEKVTLDTMLPDTMLPQEPVVLLLPAIQRDCLGVKLAQQALLHNPYTVIALYGATLPAKQFLCLAYREGVADIIALDADTQTLSTQIRRLGKRLSDSRTAQHSSSHHDEETQAIRHLWQKAEREGQRLNERLAQLATTAGRLGTGQLNLAQMAPTLHIVAASESQSEEADLLARQLGFESRIARHARSALTLIKEYPPDVILSDSVLEDMQVTEFAKQAREALGDRPVTIVVWSSTPELEETLLTPDSGIDDFVLKSPDMEKAPLLTASLLGAIR